MIHPFILGKHQARFTCQFFNASWQMLLHKTSLHNRMRSATSGLTLECISVFFTQHYLADRPSQRRVNWGNLLFQVITKASAAITHYWFWLRGLLSLRYFCLQLWKRMLHLTIHLHITVSPSSATHNIIWTCSGWNLYINASSTSCCKCKQKAVFDTVKHQKIHNYWNSDCQYKSAGLWSS